MLCLIIEKTTGPTAMLNNKPNVIPFHNASNIIPREKYKVQRKLKSISIEGQVTKKALIAKC